MKRPAIIAITVLGVLLLISLGVNLWQYHSEEVEMSRWVETAAKLKVESEQHRQARDEAERAAFLSEAELEAYEALADDKEEEVAVLKKKLRKRSQIPKEALPYVDERDAVITAQDFQLDLTKAGLEACKKASAEKSKALFESKAADNLSEEQAEGWHTYSKKQKRKYRTKVAFTAIGIGVVSGVGGYYAGRASK